MIDRPTGIGQAWRIMIQQEAEIKKLRGKILVLSSVERVRKEILVVDENYSTPIHTDEEVDRAVEHLASLEENQKDEDGSYPPQLFNTEIADSFCSFCGASIPHREGEGRCPMCMHHIPLKTKPADNYHPQKGHGFSPEPEDTTEITDQALAAMDAEKDDPWAK